MLGKHTLGPKEETSLRITFDTTGNPGPFRKVVTLTTDASGEKELEVTIEGSVIESPCAKIQVVPRRLDLGTVSRGPVKIKPLAISNPGSLPLVITKIYVRGTGAVLREGSQEGNLIIAPGETRAFEASISASSGPGDYQETIVIESNAKNAAKGGYLILIRYKSE